MAQPSSVHQSGGTPSTRSGPAGSSTAWGCRPAPVWTVPGAPRPTGIVARRGVVEVYPAAALALWGFAFKGYKRNSGTPAAVTRDKRVSILADLERVADAWLILSDDVRAACIDNDDPFDAFVSSLVACAAATNNLRPLIEQRGAAQREGWIHLPSPDSIESLAPAAA